MGGSPGECRRVGTLAFLSPVLCDHEVMGEDSDGRSRHSPASAHNESSGVVHGSLVQAHSIHGDVVVTAGTSTRSEVDEWAEGLAQGVETLLRREEAHRRVHDPLPLPVRWHPSTLELADHWANIRRLQAGATAEPVALAGRIEQISEVYRRIPSGRLVLLGQAGAGKTVLASHLALHLLAARRPGQRVPVIVSVGSWNPATTPLKVWLAGQLARDHPGLAAPAEKGGPSRAAALIAAGRVLPILDGFDEIDAGLHQAALRQLNTTPDDPMVITSRVAEYTTAVREVDVLTAAAVVELDDLTLQDLAAYLPRTAAGLRTGMWDPVLERMRAEPHAPGPARLHRVLTNPLMVFLARTVYSDAPGHDPTQLLDTHRFPTAQDLQDHLLAAFVPAVYQDDQPGNTRGWPADRAHRYLTYLAGHLHKAGTRDLAWWQLRDTIPRPHRTLIFAVVDGLLTGLMVGLASGPRGFTFGLTSGLTFGLLTALASGLTVALTVGLTRGLRGQHPRGKPQFISGKVTIALLVGLLVTLLIALVRGLAEVLEKGISGLTSAPHLGAYLGIPYGLAAALVAGLVGFRRSGPRPTRTRLQIRGKGRFIAGLFAVGLAAALVNTFVPRLVSALTSPLSPGLVYSLTTMLEGLLTFDFVGKLAVGLTFGLAAALAFGLEAPVNAADVVSPAESLARDRRTTLRKMLAVGLAAGPLAGLTGVSMLAAGPWGWLAAAMAAGFVGVRATSAWIYWLVLVRGWLPLTGRLPWRVQAFLTDAYQRGVLRQTGAVYQFRHARLQDRLSAGPPVAVRGGARTAR